MTARQVTREAFRFEVAERIPGAIATCARALEIEPSELLRMAERGELTTDHLAPVMSEELRAILG